MSYCDYEDYYEPSEFDEKVEEFKDCLRDSVKQETKELIEKLQRENENLRNIKNNWNSLENDYKRKQTELEREINICKSNASRMRLDELFKECGMNMILYKPDYFYVYKKKCDKCDNNRYIHFKSPSGNDCKEECACAKRYCKYKPSPYYCVEFRNNRYNAKTKYPLLMWFKKYRDYSSDYDGYTYDSSDLCRFIYNGEDFEHIKKEYDRNVYFRNEDECQAYCDYRNKKNGITDDMSER